MPVDIEQWRAEIWNFNGCCQYPVERFESGRLHKIFSTIVISACLFLLILFSNLNTILHFLLLSSVFDFSPSVLELLIYKTIFLFKDFSLLYWISQLYSSTNFIHMYVKYYQFFQCFVLCVLFASPFPSAWRYSDKSWSTEWPS